MLDVRKSVVTAFVFLFALGSASLAGPLVTVEFFDGRKIEAEIQGFKDREFILREYGREETEKVREARIKSIDFGEKPFNLPDLKTPEPDKPLDTADLWRDVEGRLFERLFLQCRRDVFRERTSRVLAFKEQIEEKLGTGDLAREDRRDHLLAMVVAMYSLRDRDKALRWWHRIQQEYPADAVVRRFADILRRAADRRRRWDAIRPGRGRPPRERE